MTTGDLTCIGQCKPASFFGLQKCHIYDDTYSDAAAGHRGGLQSFAEHFSCQVSFPLVLATVKRFEMLL